MRDISLSPILNFYRNLISQFNSIRWLFSYNIYIYTNYNRQW